MRRIRTAGLRFGVLVATSAVVLAGLVVTFAGARVPSGQGQAFAPGSGSLLGDPLVVASAEALVGGQQDAAAIARRANPQALFARWRSREAYSHLSRAQAVRLAEHSFPGTVDAPAGGRPDLPVGARVLGYRSYHAVEISLPGHRRGIVESSSQIARRAGAERFVPVSLTLVRAGGGFAPERSGAPERIPGRLADGVELAGVGVTLTPVSAGGQEESGEAVLARASVLYPNSGPTTDTLVKPTLSGFQLDAMLRSAASPSQLYFRVGAPAGSRLVQDSTGTVQVRRGARTLASIVPPRALDAAGTSVPASMRVSGRTLVVSVAHRAGSYLYPIDVDPEVNDVQLAKTSGGKRSNWEFHTSNGARFGHSEVYEGVGKEHLQTTGIAEYAGTEWAYWGYETKGNSKIYELKAKTSAKNAGSKIESFLEFEGPGGSEKPKKLLSTEGSEPEYSEKSTVICAWNASKVEECLPAAGKEKNAVHFQQSATTSPAGKYGFSDSMSEGIVSISEPSGTHSKTSFDTTTPELEFETEVEGKKVLVKRKNALYGSGTWLTKAAGALKMNAEDPGIGVAATKLEYESSPATWTLLSNHEYLEKENACQGVQCYASHSEYASLDPKLPDGEQKVRYRAEEAIPGTISLTSEGQATVKVDTSAPHRIKINGLPYGDELSERPYELAVEATDGEGSTVVSSGIKQLALYIDGVQFGTVGGSCTAAKGECTASDTWTVNGAELGYGHHAIVVVTSDNAGNEARAEKTISIRHSTPVSLGPGSVDLQSGDFTLGASDASMGSGLSVGRNYSSRAAGVSKYGPFGGQWNLSVGTTESLAELYDGGVMLTSGNGKQTIFAPLGGGKFESPPGDSNLDLTLEENGSKEKLAYYLKDLAKGTSVKFTRPSSNSVWVPTKQEGTVASDTVTANYQASESRIEYKFTPSETEAENITVGPDGNMWVTEKWVSKIAKVTPGGVITEYPAGMKESEWMNAIATGPDGDLWYSSDWAINKMTPSGTVTKYGLTIEPRSITKGPDGKMWFLFGVSSGQSNYVGNITTSGAIKEYSLPSGSNAEDITTGPDGNLWFTENGTGKIGKITPAGTITEYALPAGSKPEYIIAGADGNLWYSESSAKKIGKISTIGSNTEYSVSASYFGHLALGNDGNIWFDGGAAEEPHMWKMAPSGALTTYNLPWEKGGGEMVSGPGGDLWYVVPGGFGQSAIGIMPLSGSVVEPTQVLAAKPAGVSCEPELKAGCRALKFKYATKITAKGEASSEWGEYTTRLKNVMLDAYDPVSKSMKEVAVAEYSYDPQGRLRAEWDPRVSPALKTTYGYDEEGHVTALNPPGLEPWTFTYGTSATDAGAGRLLKLSQAGAEQGLWGGTPLKNTAAPSISGSAVVGARLAVSNGSWTGSPLKYGYKWEDCASGSVCKTILGANSANYTPTFNDVGSTLIAVVSATSGGGGVAATSAATATVAATYRQTSVDGANSVNAVACVPATIDCAVGDSKGNAFYSTNVSASAASAWSAWSGPGASPAAAASCPTTSLCMLATGGNLYYATSLGGAWSLAYSPAWGVDAVSCPSSSFCISGQNGKGYFRYSTSPTSTSWTLEQQGTAVMKAVSCLSSSFCIIADGSGSVHVATTTAQAESSAWTVTSVGSTALNGVACTSTTTCIAVDSAGNALKLAIAAGGEATAVTHNIDGTSSLTAVSCPTTKKCVAVDNKGKVFVSGNSGETWTLQYQMGDSLTSLSCPSTSLCVAADSSGNVAGINPREGSISEGEAKTPQLGSTMEYEVPLSGGSGLPVMTGGEVAKWGQSDDPVEATAIIAPDSRQGWPASSYARATTYYLDEEGRTVNVSAPSEAMYGSISTTEYNEFNDVVRSLSPRNRQTALEAGSAKSVEVSKLLDTINTYDGEGAHESEVEEPGTRLLDAVGPQHEVKYSEGGSLKESLAREHTKYFYDEGAPGGEKYGLLTKVTTLAQLANEEEREVRKTVKAYSGQSNLGWKLRAPTSVTQDPEGKKVTTTTIYNPTTAQIAETRGAMGSGGESPRDAKVIYYTAEANSEGYTSCGAHPEWAGLTCEVLPAKQPGGGAPPVAVTAVTAYNMWNERETTTETFGSTVRTKKQTYDAAGRLATSETTSSADVALPAVSNEYSTSTGALVKQSTTVEAKTTSIASKYNTLGQLTEYVDADGAKTSYYYGEPENDNLLEEVVEGVTGHWKTQTLSYNATTKQLSSLWDSAAKTFTATYDVEGELASEVYPNGLCANTVRNSVGEATGVEYIKTTKCSESGAPVWFSETRGPSVRGETFSRASTLASEQYGYDTLGRLTEVQETPAGEGCSVRLYGYDEASNRTSQTTRAPGTGGKCETEGGTLQEHTYDEANRLADGGVGYDSIGNITKLPAADAEGHELTSTFYVDGAVATQSQNGVTNNYHLDPEGRVRETVTGSATTVNHYDSSGEAVAWTSEGAKETRNIVGIDGTLAAIQTNGETPVLQLHDLQGNIVATASLSTEATKLLSTYNSTEFGVPNGEKAPPKFAWLGAADVGSALSSGAITYGATAYVPQIGRALQTQEVEAPGLPDGTGAGAAYTSQEEPWNMQGAAREGAEAPGLEAAREREAAEAACRANPAACETGGGEEDSEGGPADPSLWISLTAKEAKTLADALDNSQGSLEALAKSGAIKKFTMRWVNLIKQWWGRGALAEQTGMASGLYACAKGINESSGTPGRCKFKLDYFDYRQDGSNGNGTPQANEILGGYEVYLCWGEHHSTGVWTYPYCSLENGVIPPK